mmetsp:Transcript_6302/g.9604  ORF Transcript_6302/g.9604 Transcript_6302/m.9604 type:complete len:221 (+) Transcript_6302:66-728(+)|eukprot:CAMPEP_0118681692 /NCGR_PEP_ID=MMETSP0800-20121206/5079_1 /TAXON_ID=210618 ORGANISM="Striatella unipunctata, Strain CCMP2910" /NCGR_SAMPLE_ID=MMETSP0800 /ASSEMBLY_ACC=CAM_ASM_000638 /LENGTH=220 /DNA_ID=CAMNT_0006578015 /DNA_START=69 /DNA_END=731 /DNA_ORIENTATION=+
MSSSLRAPVIALFSGSSRVGSFNTQLTKAAEKIALGLGADTKVLDLASYNLPLYNQDTEGGDGIPQEVLHLKQDLASADGWIVASPEYNGFVTPLFLNAITWASRGDAPGEMYATFANKCAVVLSASPGAMGGLRAHNPNHQLLTNLGVNVLPHSVAVGGAFKAFDENTGELVDEKMAGMLNGAVSSLFYLTRDVANREATCKIIQEHIKPVGEYGSVTF